MRQDVVENAIKSSGELVDIAIGEDMCLRDCDIASVVHDVLIAAKRILLSEPRRAAGHEVCRLVVAEARKDRILRREIVIHAHVERSLVQAASGTLL